MADWLVIKRGGAECEFSFDLVDRALVRTAPDGASREVSLSKTTPSGRQLHGVSLYSLPGEEGELGAGCVLSMNESGQLVLTLDPDVCCRIDRSLFSESTGEQDTSS